MNRELERAVGTLNLDLKGLRGDLKNVFGAVKGKAGEYLISAKDSAREGIGRRPFASVLVALGAGLVLGALLARSRRKKVDRTDQ